MSESTDRTTVGLPPPEPVEGEITRQLIRAKWGELFSLPAFKLPEKMRLKSSDVIPIAVFDLEIAHEKGTVTGELEVGAEVRAIPNMGLFRTEVSSGGHGIDLIQPAGDVPIEFSLVAPDPDTYKSPEIVATKLPLIISVSTLPMTFRSGDDVRGRPERVRHFAIFGEDIIGGEMQKPHQKNVTANHSWEGLNRGGNNTGTVWLPYDASVFEKIKFVVSDAPPSVS